MRIRPYLAVLALVLSQLITLSVSFGASPEIPKGAFDATLLSFKALTPNMFGVSTGQPVADVSVILLSNGKLRAYVFAQNKGIEIAESSDNGKTFTRVGNAFGGDKGNGQPRAVALSDGRVRLYTTSSGGVNCSISTDGLTFTLEKANCLLASDYSESSGLAGPGVVQLSTGKWRAYFSGLPKAGTGPDPWKMYSASSDDGVDWIRDAGVRIGTGSSSIKRSAEHPTAIRHSDNSITVFYFDDGADPEGTGKIYSNGNGLHYSHSSDGLNFSEEKWFDMVKIDSRLSGTEMNDPDVVLDKDGNVLLFGGGFAHDFGGYINVMVLKPGQGTPAYTGDRCLAAKILPGGPPNPPCGVNVVQPTPVTQPTPNPIVSSEPSPTQSLATKPSVKKITITCVKGKTIKKISGATPKCPAGYKKK
ncbi:MAG: sialidase family protein [Candidatus Planktophila sp.]|nr:sialidase family protein [Candidatus Planktophila sp.]